MKTKTTYIPADYTGQNFNEWQKHLQEQLDKIKGTNLATRL